MDLLSCHDHDRVDLAAGALPEIMVGFKPDIILGEEEIDWSWDRKRQAAQVTDSAGTGCPDFMASQNHAVMILMTAEIDGKHGDAAANDQDCSLGRRQRTCHRQEQAADNQDQDQACQIRSPSSMLWIAQLYHNLLAAPRTSVTDSKKVQGSDSGAGNWKQS